MTKVRLLAAILLAIGSALSVASPASATTETSTCSGKTAGGMCFYRNTNFVPPSGWFTHTQDVAHFGYWFYNNTGISMHDSVSSAQTRSTGCDAYTYTDVGYLGELRQQPKLR